MLILYIAITAICGYILGAANGAIIISKLIYKKDIRDYGSGNAGITNFHRVFGAKSALLVAAIDILKVVGPILLGGWLLGKYGYRIEGKQLAGLCAMLGHCFPVFYGFRGGKGILAGGATLLLLDWRVALICWGLFILAVVLTRYVSLGSILAAAAYPVSVAIFLPGVASILMALASAVLLIGRHHANIGRLIHGTESKLTFKK
jgi:glycerol-3-phosphate acyltransferase PlsY